VIRLYYFAHGSIDAHMDIHRLIWMKPVGNPRMPDEADADSQDIDVLHRHGPTISAGASMKRHPLLVAMQISCC
jgi:hypothetical protein